MTERIAIVSFSEKGNLLAHKLQNHFGGTVTCGHGNKEFSLKLWTENAFSSENVLIFIGAVGIAVRSIAPYIKSKITDPAVICIDECGKFAVPILSGHLGGANDFAREIGSFCGAIPVITTATDCNSLFPVDQWARIQNLFVYNPHMIKIISAEILSRNKVTFWSRFNIKGTMPAELCYGNSFSSDIVVDIYKSSLEALQLVPMNAVIGVGCKKDTSFEIIEDSFLEFCAERNILPESIVSVASIDLKSQEYGLIQFCDKHNYTKIFFSAEELNNVKGEFTSSPFVKKITGVDNVCERSAVLASGGDLIEKKFSKNGVTFALALKPVDLEWRW